MNVIGITGKAGSGKNTVAAFLAAALNDQGYSVRIDSFSNSMKKFIRENFKWYGHKDDFWRRVLQEFGMHKRELDKNYWIADLCRRTPSIKPFAPDFLIISGVRFIEEVEYVREYGVLWMVSGRVGLQGDNAEHASEKLDFELTDRDLEIVNDGDLKYLKRVVEVCIDFKLHLPKKHKEADKNAQPL